MGLLENLILQRSGGLTRYPSHSEIIAMFFFSPSKRAKSGAADGQPRTVKKAVVPDHPAGKVFRTLTLPGGHKVRVMREDAYRAALAGAARHGS